MPPGICSAHRGTSMNGLQEKRKAFWKYCVLQILEIVNDGIPPLVGNGRANMRKRHLTNTAAYPEVR